ncbi:MAG: hypothetical protein U5L96_17010 [Owenweeksia sp.]|nr:hypothetical protein [Owenweeksia sp.]
MVLEWHVVLAFSRARATTQVREIKNAKARAFHKLPVDKNITSRMLQGFDVKPQPDYLNARTTVLFNADVHLSLAAPQKSLRDYF